MERKRKFSNDSCLIEKKKCCRIFMRLCVYAFMPFFFFFFYWRGGSYDEGKRTRVTIKKEETNEGMNVLKNRARNKCATNDLMVAKNQ
jgi:hypothetical protein